MPRLYGGYNIVETWHATSHRIQNNMKRHDTSLQKDLKAVFRDYIIIKIKKITI